MVVPVKQTEQDDRQICHAINNRMNAIVIGVSILEHHDSQDVRDIVQLLQRDLDELQTLLKQVQPSST